MGLRGWYGGGVVAGRGWGKRGERERGGEQRGEGENRRRERSGGEWGRRNRREGGFGSHEFFFSFSSIFSNFVFILTLFLFVNYEKSYLP